MNITQKGEISKERIRFRVVKCIASGRGFQAGCYYAQTGDNNGIQIQRANDEGDCETLLTHAYSFDDDLYFAEIGGGIPQFQPVAFMVDGSQIVSVKL